MNCSKKENPVESQPPIQSSGSYNHILTLQENLNTTLTNLLVFKDTTAALDSIKNLFLLDTSVIAAYSDIQGINVQYKNGMRGGIFINGDDEESSSLGKTKKLFDSSKKLNSSLNVIPTSKSAIFINPHYFQRSELLIKYNSFIILKEVSVVTVIQQIHCYQKRQHWIGLLIFLLMVLFIYTHMVCPGLQKIIYWKCI